MKNLLNKKKEEEEKRKKQERTRERDRHRYSRNGNVFSGNMILRAQDRRDKRVD